MEALTRCVEEDTKRCEKAQQSGTDHERVFRFFDKNGDYYQVIDDDARQLATRFFHSTSVLKFAEVQGRTIPFLSLSPAVFTSVVKSLLAEKNTTVCTFAFSAGKWTLKREGSAGRVNDFATEMNSLSDVDRASVEQACIACAWVATPSANTAGVAILNTTFRTLGVTEVGLDALEGLLVQENVTQCIVAGSLGNDAVLKKVELSLRAAGTRRLSAKKRPGDNMTPAFVLEHVATLFGLESVAQVDSFLHSFIQENVRAANALFYLLNEEGLASNVSGFDGSFPYRAVHISLDNSMYISPSTLRALSLFPRANSFDIDRSTKSEYSSVYHLLGKACRTPMGARLLSRWLRRPSKDINTIRLRHDVVSSLVNDESLEGSIEKSIYHLPDGERLALSLASLHIKEEDSLLSVKQALNTLVNLFKLTCAADQFFDICKNSSSLHCLSESLDLPRVLEQARPFSEHIANIIDTETLRAAFRQRGYDARVAAHCSPRLSELQTSLQQINASIRAQAISFAGSIGADQIRIRGHGQFDEAPQSIDVVASESPVATSFSRLSSRGKKAAGSRSSTSRKRKRAVTLNLERNAVHGTLFRMTRADSQTILRKNGPAHSHKPRIISRDKQGVKFTIEALSQLVERHDALDADYLQAQIHIVQQALVISKPAVDALLHLAHAMASIDVLIAFAKLSRANEYCRPMMLDSTNQEIQHNIEFTNLRHVLAEQLLGRDLYIANDFRCKQPSVSIVSGPNMGGKSTYSNSVALATVLAQAGCFVPADTAQIPVFDSVLARAGGALDDSSTGASTFMVEMRDIASILAVATSRSLVIVDEIGRGTSTNDGFALAKAITEHFVRDVCCTVLFATHFHELAHLEKEFPQSVQNLQLTAKVQGDDVVMLYKVKEGAADKSYGISVAKMAGFPTEILANAAQELQHLVASSE